MVKVEMSSFNFRVFNKELKNWALESCVCGDVGLQKLH